MDARQERGLVIAATSKIEQKLWVYKQVNITLKTNQS